MKTSRIAFLTIFAFLSRAFADESEPVIFMLYPAEIALSYEVTDVEHIAEAVKNVDVYYMGTGLGGHFFITSTSGSLSDALLSEDESRIKKYAINIDLASVDTILPRVEYEAFSSNEFLKVERINLEENKIMCQPIASGNCGKTPPLSRRPQENQPPQ